MPSILSDLKEEKEKTAFQDGVKSCMNLVDESMDLYARGYYDSDFDTVEDVLDNLKLKMKDLLT